MTPPATIVIPALNEEEYIGAAIESALAGQTRADVLIVDDGSFDRTVEIANSYDRVRVVPCNGRGIVDVNNTGLHAAQGEIVIHLDAGSRLVTGAVDALLAPFESPDVTLVAGSTVVNNGRETIGAKIVFPTHQHIATAAMSGNPISHSGVALRRRSIIEIGGYQAADGTEYGEDYDLWLRLLAAGHRTVGVTQTVAIRTLRSHGISARHHEVLHRRLRPAQRAYRTKTWERDARALIELGRALRGEEYSNELLDRWSISVAMLAYKLMRDRRPGDALVAGTAAVSLGPLRLATALIDHRGRMKRYREVKSA